GRCRRPWSALDSSRTQAAAPTAPSTLREGVASGPRGRLRASSRSGRPPLDLLPFQLEPVAGPVAVRPERTADGLDDAVEEHVLDPDVVVEVLEMSAALDR